MFYSHELLTNRQYGVATIWLVATLGSKSSLKKVTRKAILDVDVPKACTKITDPATPLALRLQGSLLYGISRVYNQQCMYVLADTQSFRDKMRGIEQIMKEMELDPNIGKTRPEQLNLPEDPAFNPETDMYLDLALFEIPTDNGTSPASSILSGLAGRTPASSQPSAGGAGNWEEPVIDLPSMDTPGGLGGFEFAPGAVFSAGAKSGNQAEVEDAFEESGVIEVPEFEFDDEGNLVLTDAARQSATHSATGDAPAVSESGVSARVRAEHDAGVAEEQLFYGLGKDDPFIFGEDEGPPLPSAEPLPTVAPEGLAMPPLQDRPESSAQHSHESTTTTTAEAPQRRARQHKQLQVDERAEMSNRQLGEWSTNYLATMHSIARAKANNKSAALARKNAAFWILEQGVGRVDENFGDDHFPHPLSVFNGHSLMEALRGLASSPAGSKRARSRSADAGEDEDGRRVRARTVEEGEEWARGEDVAGPVLDDNGIIPQDDEYPRDIESEVGRRAPSSLPDPSSAMPWNVSSRAGSAHRFGSAGHGISSGAARPGGFPLGPPSVLSRRRSRLTSASPLGAKAPRLPSLAIVSDISSAGNEGVWHDDDEMELEGAVDADEFELFGPSAVVDTQTAAQSQWLKSALENEAYNFLDFLETQIEERRDEFAATEQGRTIKTITLDDLLPPAANSRVVAAQAMLHVLALTTKGLIEVKQEEAFGDIRMRVVRNHAEHVEGDDDGAMAVE